MGSRARVSNRKSPTLEISSFSQVLEHLEEPAFLADANGRILYANPAFKQAYRNGMQQVRRKKLKHLSQVTGLKQPASGFSSLQKDAAQRRQRPRSDKKGNVFWPSFSVSAIHGAASKVEGYLAIHGNGSREHGALGQLLQRNKELTMLNAISSEISRTLSMEKVFKVVLERVRKTFGANDGLLFVLDSGKQELRCVSASGAICRRKRELDLLRTVKVGKGITGRVAASGKPALVTDVVKGPRLNRPQVIRRLGIRSQVSVPLKCHGRVLGVLNLGYLRRREFSREDELLLAAVGNVVGVAIEHIEHDQRIKDLMARYRALIDKASDGVLLADRTGRYVEANQMMCKMLGYSRSEIVGKRVGTFVAEYPKRKVRENFSRLMQQGYIRAQRNMRRNDGTIVPVEVTANRIQIGNEYFSQAIYRDLTERLKTEQETRRYNRELTILNSISEVVSRSLDLTKILNTALEKICEGLSVEAATLFIMDEDGKRLHLEASRGVSERLRAAISQFRVGKGFTGRVAKTGKPAIINVGLSRGKDIIHAALRARHQSFVSVPIKSPTRVLGVLEAASREPRKFTCADVSLLTAIGYQIGTAIEKVRLFETVKSEKEKLDSILSAIDEGVQIVDRDYTIQYQNRWSRERIGDVEGQQCYRVHHGRSQPCQSCPMMKAIEQNKIVHREGQGKDGRTYEVATVPMYTNGRSRVAIEITRDITERKQAEEALRNERQRLFSLLEQLPAYVYLLAPDHAIRYANRYFRQQFGNPEGKTCYELFMSRRKPCEQCPTLRVLDSKRPEEWEWTWPGNNCVYRIYDYLFTDIDGSPLVLEFGIDVTELRRAEQAVRESEEKYRNVVERGNDGIVLVQDSQIRYANQHLAEICGYRVEELVDTPFITYICPEERPKILNSYTRRMAGEKVVSVYESALLHKDGHKVPIEINAGLISYQGKSANLAFIRDITERKQTEEALRASKQLLERTLNSLRDAVFIIDANTLTIVDCNPAASEIFGYSRDEMLGQTTTFLHVEPSKLEEFRKHLYPAVEKKGFLSQLEFAMKRKDGTIFPSEHSVVPFDDEKGKRIGWVSVVRDITKRKRAEEALRRREQELRVIAENVPARLSYIDSGGRYRFVNKQYEEWFGLPQTEIIGKHYSEVLSEATYEIIKDRVEAALSGKRVRFEDLIPYPHGGTRWVSADYVPDVDEQGKVKGFFALVTDITEHKEAEEALRESVERFDLAARGVNEGLWDWNIMTNEVYQSPRFKEMLGYEEHEFESSFDAWESQVHPEDRERVMNAVRDHVEKGVPYDIEYRLRTKLGDYRWFSAHGQAIWNEEGKATRMAGSVRDVTEARRNEERMRHLERLATVGQVAARVAHEINNPLASLSLDLERLRDRASPDAEPAQTIQRMLDVVGRISNTVEGLLNLSKRHVLERQTVDIHTVLDDNISMLQPRFQAEGKRIVCHYDRDILHVSVDINQIGQVFTNLMVNALEALRPGGRLAIATKYLPARKQVHIIFKDEGVGIPAQIRSRIFEPFFSTKSYGVGLGLAISQGIVMSHGGSIEVENHPRKGAVFSVILPVSTPLAYHDGI